MGRCSSIDLLPGAEKLFVESTIRAHRYQQIDRVHALIKAARIKVSRSALARHFRRLADQDALHCGTPHDLVVIVMERSTGSTTTFTSSAEKRLVIEAIERLSSAPKSFHPL